VEEELRSRVHALLKKAMAAEKSVAGNVHMYRAEDETLVMIVQEGLKRSFIEHFRITKPFDSTPCGRAIGIGSPILISNIEEDVGFKPHRRITRSAGIRAIISVPILGKNGKRLGVISNHFAEPKWRWHTNRLDNILPEFTKPMEKLTEMYKGRPANLIAVNEDRAA
jgi:GAF domain-containing protein